MHQLVVAGGDVGLHSPSTGAPSISSSVHQHISDWLGVHNRVCLQLRSGFLKRRNYMSMCYS